MLSRELFIYSAIRVFYVFRVHYTMFHTWYEVIPTRKVQGAKTGSLFNRPIAEKSRGTLDQYTVICVTPNIFERDISPQLLVLQREFSLVLFSFCSIFGYCYTFGNTSTLYKALLSSVLSDFFHRKKHTKIKRRSAMT